MRDRVAVADMPPFRRPASRSLRLALPLTFGIAALDVMLGSDVVLIGLLVFGPACAAASLRPLCTLGVSLWAIALAIALGVPDGIWASFEHLTFVGVVAFVGVIDSALVAVLSLRVSAEVRGQVR